ncbi:hypothetical protein AVEN_87165-1 [Araneus ventricosus]|uniref:Uncharacterized protein n=1 Tax=Araneus ventricosus TaxID=182803 RepID=A0A4Y2H1A5_ARAVE|nr:hypothetical protein AVEN_87165-1 [Araneus ventricosus]
MGLCLPPQGLGGLMVLSRLREWRVLGSKPYSSEFKGLTITVRDRFVSSTTRPWWPDENQRRCSNIANEDDEAQIEEHMLKTQLTKGHKGGRDILHTFYISYRESVPLGVRSVPVRGTKVDSGKHRTKVIKMKNRYRIFFLQVHLKRESYAYKTYWVAVEEEYQELSVKGIYTIKIRLYVGMERFNGHRRVWSVLTVTVGYGAF